MAKDFSMLQGANRATHNEMLREKRQRALGDAFIERRLELAGIPPLPEAEKAPIRADINARFQAPDRAPGEEE